MEKICKQCNSPFDGRKGRLFCSRNCWREYLKTKTVYCETCGVPLTTLQRCSGNRFCSRECFAITQRGRPRKGEKERKHGWRDCPTCGKRFLPKNAEIKYCSRECYYASYRQQEFTCRHCGNAMRGRPNRAFCSPECYNQFRKEHRAPPKLPYGPSWKQQRRRALKRDNYKCQECGGTTNGRAPDVHHIVPFAELGIERHKEANALTNLITLCRSCHMKAHNGALPEYCE